MNGGIPEISNIEQPRLWRLALQLEPELLRAVMWSTVEDSTLVQFSLPLDPGASGHKALEEAVYAAPVLLSDFGRVDVVVRGNRYLVAPTVLGSDLGAEALAYCCLSDSEDADTVMTDHIEASGCDIVWALDEGTSGFLARTFRNPAVMSHMTPLLRYFGRKGVLGHSARAYAHFSECPGRREADVIVYGPDGKLAMAATHLIGSEDDALYYILAGMQEAGLDPHNDEVLLCGNSAVRDAVMPRLRRYAANAMPVIFPSAAYRAGRESLRAPFPLVILPLCE